MMKNDALLYSIYVDNSPRSTDHERGSVHWWIELVAYRPPLHIPEIFVGLHLQVSGQPLTILPVEATRVSICFLLLRIFAH